MTTLHQISIKSNVNNDYQSTITLAKLGEVSYCVITLTEHKEVKNEFIEMYETYREALRQFMDNVQEYAHHTALMNL